MSYPGLANPSKNYEDPAILEQYRIASHLGACPKGGLHELRSHYTMDSLFLAFCFFARCCGYARKVTVCKQCGRKFEGVYFPEAGSMGPPVPQGPIPEGVYFPKAGNMGPPMHQGPIPDPAGGVGDEKVDLGRF